MAHARRKLKIKRPSDFNGRMHALVEESIQRFEDRSKPKREDKSKRPANRP